MKDKAIDVILKSFENATTEAYTHLATKIDYDALDKAYATAQAEIQKQVTLGKIDELEHISRNKDWVTDREFAQRIAALQAELEQTLKEEKV